MKIQLAVNFYTQESIENMLEQFSDYLKGSCTFDNEIHLNLCVSDAFQGQQMEIINSFLNNILELSVQEKIKNEC